MPIRHGGILASRASTWPRDHFCRSTIAPRSSSPTTWNEFLPISMPITATSLLRFWDMACSLSLEPLARFVTGGAGARPDHPISGHEQHAFDYFPTANLTSYDASARGLANGSRAFVSSQNWRRTCNALLLLVLQYSFPPLWPPRHKLRHQLRRDLRKRTTTIVSGQKVCFPRSSPSHTQAR